jgi:4-hydroxybenzoyl-CoA thioesterase
MTPKIYRQLVHFPFGDADIAKILYFPRLFHYCHIVMEGFVKEATGKSYQSLLQERRLGFPTVRTEADYAAPMPYGKDLQFEFTLTQLGTSSMGFRWRVFMEGEEQLRAEALSTVVCVNMDQFKSAAIPPVLRAVFEPYLELSAR